MVEAKLVGKRYLGKQAVKDVNMVWEDGRIYALLGPNGSGKTTFMKMVAGLVKPTSGTLYYNNEKIGVESKKRVAYMSTEPFFYPYMNVKQLMDVIKEFFHALTGVEIRLIEVIYIILMVLIAWLFFIAMAMFAITLSTTLLSNWKFKGVASVAIFFGVDWLVAKAAGLVIPTGFLESEYLVVSTEAWAYIGVYAAALALCYVGTALLLDKKVSV